jgi:hypothetical protein
MSLALAAALALSASTLPTCSWDRPGANPFMGDVVAAVDRYTDIPAPVRARLKARMEARQYDEIAAIRRDTVTGKRKYAPEIRDMHFGQGTLCRTVTRSKWSDDTVERGLVYCEAGHCILVPTVCRNVSRIKRLGSERVASAGDEPLLAPEERLARSGDADSFSGGAGGGGLPGSGDAPMLSLNATPFTDAGAGGDASFQAVSGLAGFSLPALEIGGSTIPRLAAPGGGDGDAGIPWAAGAGPGGFNPGPVAGVGTVGSIGSLGGGTNPGNPGSPGIAGMGGSGTDGFGPASPLPGVGGGGGLELGPQSRLPSNNLAIEVSNVPEPGTWAIWLLGLAGVVVAARRR